MNDYKKSLYTHIVTDKDKMILYNTQSKKMAYSLDKDKILSILSGDNYTEVDLKNRMIEDGYMVNSSVDEKTEAMLNYHEQIFDNSLSLTMLPTEQCNFRCKYCYEKFEKGKMSDEIVNGIIRYLRQNIGKHSKIFLNWFGGEPLLAMDVIENISLSALHFSQKTHIPLFGGIVTNGYLLSSDVVKTLLKYRVNNFQITLDGPSSIHNIYRTLISGKPTFDVILNNLRDIRDNIKFSMLSILIRVNVTEESFEGMEQFLDLMETEFGNDNRFKLFLHPVGNWGGEHIEEISSNSFTNFSRIFGHLTQRKRLSAFLTSAYEDHITSGLCYAAKRNNYVIGSDGTIYKCTVNLENEMNQVGNVQSNGTFDLDYKKLSQWVVPKNILSECQHCAFSKYCLDGRCPIHKIKSKNILEDCICSQKIEIDYIIKLLMLSEDKHKILY